MRPCPTCDDTGWVCENHQNLPWDGGSQSITACGCGSGIQCQDCNDGPEVSHERIIKHIICEIYTMPEKYILRDREPVQCSDLMEWAKWLETGERCVATDEIGEVRISTVFLGINHRFGEGAPLLFETMIFGGLHDGYQERSSTWSEAEAQHAAALALARGALN